MATRYKELPIEINYDDQSLSKQYSSTPVNTKSASISDAGLDFMLGKELYRGHRHWDGKKYVMGYGYSGSAFSNGITETNAYRLWITDVTKAQNNLRKRLNNSPEFVLQHQWDALVSMFYDTGSIDYTTTEGYEFDLIYFIQKGTIDQVSSAIQIDNRKPSRRVAEASLFRLCNYGNMKPRSWLRNEGIQHIRKNYLALKDKDGNIDKTAQQQAQYAYYKEVNKFIKDISEIDRRRIINLIKQETDTTIDSSTPIEQYVVRTTPESEYKKLSTLITTTTTTEAPFTSLPITYTQSESGSTAGGGGGGSSEGGGTSTHSHIVAQWLPPGGAEGQFINHLGSWSTPIGSGDNSFNGVFANLTERPTTIAGYGILDAFIGNYNDLTNKPDLFSGSYDDLTDIPSNFTGASSSTSGAYGFVPSPIAGDQLKYLSATGIWSVPPNTTYVNSDWNHDLLTNFSEDEHIDWTQDQSGIPKEIHVSNYAGGSPFGGATSSTDGTAGTVPAPVAGDQVKFLKGDRTWSVVASYDQTLNTTDDVTFDDLIVNGNLTVNGTETIVNTSKLEVEDHTIEIGKVATPTNDTADGGGIILKAANDKTITWSKTTDMWGFNTSVNIGGLVHISTEQGSAPTPQADGDGGYLYTKADGKPYWISYDQAETDLSDPGAQTVSGLTDTTISTPSGGDVLTWDGTNNIWKNLAGAAGSLTGLSDTTITTPSTGQILTWNGTTWVNQANAGSGGSSLVVAEINDPSSNVNVASVSQIQFDVDSGFALTDLTGGIVKVAMESTFKKWNVSGQDTLIATAVDEVTLAQGNGITLTTTAPPSTTQTYYVKFSGGKYIFEDATGIVGAGNAITSFNFIASGTYKFDTSNATLTSSQFEFSTTPYGTHNSGTRYTNGITYGDSGGRIADGTAGAFLQIKGKNDTATTLYDYNEDSGGSGDSSIAIFSAQQKTLTITNEIVDDNNNVVVDGKYIIPSVIGAAGQVLQFPASGSTLEWVNQSTGMALTDLSATTVTANAVSTLIYNNQTGVFTYTPLAEQDPVFLASPAGNITTAKISNWDTGYLWGDHSTEGYLTSYTETDPVFGAHVSSGITQQKITNWDAAHGWGDHASANYFDIDDDDLADIRDVDLSSMNTGTNGFFLRWNSTAQKWKEEIIVIPTVLDDLTDVDTTTTTPVLNQVLKYDGTNFTPQLDTGQNTLAGLTDTDVTGVSNGKILSYLNGTWELDDPPLTGATTITGLNDTPANYTNAAGYFVKVKSDSTGIEFVSESFLTDITAENLTDLIDVTPVLSANNTDIMYYDHPSTSFKWKKFELKNLSDLDIPGSSENLQGLYYNHSTTSFKWRDYKLTALLDVASSAQADDEKVLYYDYPTNSYKWKALTISQITDVDTPVQSDDGSFLQYDFTNSKFVWTEGGKVSVRNDGVTITNAVGYLDFVGNGVNSTATGDDVTITIDGNPTFIGQTDSPSTYTGSVGKMLIVNPNETGIQFADIGDVNTTFLLLTDVIPTSFTGAENKLVTVNSGGTGLIFTDKTFISLDDTPSTMANQGGKYIAIKNNATGLEFVSPPVQIDTFSALQDTPGISTGDSGKYIKVNTGGTALEFVSAPVDVTTFIGLTDTPSTLSGQTGKYLRVSTSGTTLELTDAPAGTLLELTDTPVSYVGSTGYLLTVSAQNTIQFTNKTALGYVGETDLTNYTVGNIISTDNVIEGNTNKYYTEARVDTNIGSKNVSALADVDYVNAPVNNDVLIWNATNGKWEPGVAPNTSSGEANTASNVGTGLGVFKQKASLDLEFYKLSAGTGISVTQQGNNIQIGNLAVSGPGGSAYIEEDDAIAFAIAFA